MALYFMSDMETGSRQPGEIVDWLILTHAINLGNTKPVQNVGHQSLEAHVLDSRNVLCSFEVHARRIRAPLASIVDQILGDFAKGSSFFAEVDDHSAASLLGLLDGFFDAEDQVRATGADVRAKDIASIAFVVYAKSEANVRIGHLCGVSKDIHSQASNRRQEELDVVASNEFWVRATSFLEQSSSECTFVYYLSVQFQLEVPLMIAYRLTDAESFRYAR
jgi:hypothetical protein